ncbi:MAG TPA: hypothetical protein ENJ12_01030 [Thiolapillus brandeum]|uniref:JmjC domain-containing protein n=1 Tax=Thiolapillus brandeum TaxID=1076588 RepID=A0A831RV30_9GAMM|nr:hypothetical protein [Thiolapillus brandeum]
MIKCFCTPIWVFRIEQHEAVSNELMSLITSLRKGEAGDPAGVSRSNQGGGWQSAFIDMTRIPLFQKALGGVMQTVAAQVGIRENSSMIVNGCWANVNLHGSYNRVHTHPDSMYSGAYYVKTPKDCGRFVALDPRPQARCITLPIDVHTPLTSPAYNHLPKEGEFVIFPSWMPHHVEENKSGEERISVAFNLFFGS